MCEWLIGSYLWLSTASSQTTDEPQSATANDNRSSSGTETIIIVIVAVVLALIVTVLVIYLLRKCRQQRAAVSFGGNASTLDIQEIANNDLPDTAQTNKAAQQNGKQKRANKQKQKQKQKQKHKHRKNTNDELDIDDEETEAQQQQQSVNTNGASIAGGQADDNAAHNTQNGNKGNTLTTDCDLDVDDEELSYQPYNVVVDAKAASDPGDPSLPVPKPANTNNSSDLDIDLDDDQSD